MKFDTMIVSLGEPGTHKEMGAFNEYVNDGWELLALVHSNDRHGKLSSLSYWRKPRN